MVLVCKEKDGAFRCGFRAREAAGCEEKKGRSPMFRVEESARSTKSNQCQFHPKPSNERAAQRQLSLSKRND